jgi:preprotein translocase subunit SecF
MLQVFHDSNFRLMWGTKYLFLAFSAFCTIGSFLVIALIGFNYGIDFAGGTAVQVKFLGVPPIDAIRSEMERAGLGDVTLQRIGAESDHEILIRVERDSKAAGQEGEGGNISVKVLDALRGMQGGTEQGERLDLNMVSEVALREWIAAHRPAPSDPAAPPPPDAAAVAAAIIKERNDRKGLFSDMSQLSTIPGVDAGLATAFKEQAKLGQFALRGVDFVGPTAGKELLQNTGWAILGAVAGILIYVWFRFHKMAWGVASIVALVHDVIIAAGAVALTGKEFSLPVVAALLTILGYSINDTIVVFDRIRENLRIYRDLDFETVVNGSVNQTLSRTILTSFTVFVAVTALFLYGGEKLNPLSFCLMVGVVFGTYSSIFVAASLLVLAYKHLGPKFVKA